MNRKAFLINTIGVAFTCCGAGITFGKALHDASRHAENGLVEIPCEDKVRFTKAWISRLIGVLDQDVDEDTRKRIMLGCGKACYGAMHGEPEKAQRMDLEEFISGLQGYLGKDNCSIEGSTIHMTYGQPEPDVDGKQRPCLCPVMEDGFEGFSATFCECSRGYISEMFERALGYKPDVQIVESLRSGDKRCHFEIRTSG